MGGLGMASAYAQAPTFSPPALPPIPGSPQPSAAPGAPAPVDPSFTPNPSTAAKAATGTDGVLSDLSAVQKGSAAPATPQPGASPSTAAVPQVAAAPTADANATTAKPPGLADLPPPVAPESSETVKPVVTTLPEVVANTSAPNNTTPPPLNLSNNVLPSLQPTPAPAKTATNNKTAPLLLPPPIAAKHGKGEKTETAAKDEKEPAAIKTWQTRLKPSIQPINTSFNYRRVLLPSEIYRASYDRDNAHLPIRTTREDYVRDLFSAATSNDINGTRALLNAGTDINATDAYGQTPLAAARRAGAYDTAALLMARGAR